MELITARAVGNVSMTPCELMEASNLEGRNARNVRQDDSPQGRRNVQQDDNPQGRGMRAAGKKMDRFMKLQVNNLGLNGVCGGPRPKSMTKMMSQAVKWTW